MTTIYQHLENLKAKAEKEYQAGNFLKSEALFEEYLEKHDAFKDRWEK
jgi:hypothetical protein